MEKNKARDIVRQRYAVVAKKQTSCCAPDMPSCGGAADAEAVSSNMGYSTEDLRAVPKGSNLGLGCGNPVALATLKQGETVLDLGSGAGIDCFLAAGRVGEAGRVIGVDMTPEMIEKARENVARSNFKNVEFRLGEIENLPVADNYADAVISNCVINLSPDKEQVFREAYRVLRPGGRLMVSDIVLLKELPDCIKNSAAAYAGCIAGAMLKKDYLDAIRAAGFKDVEVIEESRFPVEFAGSDPFAKALIEESDISPESLNEAAANIMSIKVYGRKPF